MENGITFTIDEIENEFSEKNETSLDLKIESLTELNENNEEVIINTPTKVEIKTEEEIIEILDLELPKGKTPENIIKLAKELLGVESIEKEDEEGAYKEFSLEEANLSMEDLIQLVKDKKQQELDDFKLNSVSVKNLDDNQKAIIDIIAKGGDIQALLELQKTYVDPISKLDLDVEKDQIDVIYLHGKAGGKSDEDIELIIEGLKSRGTLKEKAELAMNDLNEAVKNETVKKQKEAQDRIEATDKALKDFKKDFKTNAKTEFKDLNDASVTKLTDFVAKKKEDGKYEMDSAYMKMRSDAKLATKLALFLYDMEEYNKLITKDAPIKEAIKTEHKLRLGRLSTGSGNDKTKFEENRSLKIDF
jgi:hypothetical protein